MVKCVANTPCENERRKTNEEGIPLPYLQWNMLQHVEKPSYNNFLTSGGGTLFPPHSLDDQVSDKDLFMKLCPQGDDIWLNAMAMLNGFKVVKAFTHNLTGDDFVLNESPYVKTLWSSNLVENGNDVQIQAVWMHFNLQAFFK